MKIAPELRKRIEDAADELYAESGFKKIPTVKDVRERAGTDMNATSDVMAQWRISIRNRGLVVLDVPEAVKVAGVAAISVVWKSALETASAGLVSAQAAWDAERAHLEAVRAELAQAYEKLEAEVQADGIDTQFRGAAAERLTAKLVSLTAELAAERLEVTRLKAALKELQKNHKALLAALKTASKPVVAK